MESSIDFIEERERMKMVMKQWLYVNFRQWPTLGAHWSPPEFKRYLLQKPEESAEDSGLASLIQNHLLYRYWSLATYLSSAVHIHNSQLQQ